MPKPRVEHYVPTIEDGIPIPERAATVYTRKIFDGELQRIASQIKPGQSVVLPAGSLSKFRKIVEESGFKTFCKTVSRNGSKITYMNNDGEARVWILGDTAPERRSQTQWNVGLEKAEAGESDLTAQKAPQQARAWVLPGAIAERRKANTVELRGTPINLTKISKRTGVNLGYLSRIFARKSKGSIGTVRLIASALGMTIEEFTDSLPGISRSKRSN
jgi:hypothetical protein